MFVHWKGKVDEARHGSTREDALTIKRQFLNSSLEDKPLSSRGSTVKSSDNAICLIEELIHNQIRGAMLVILGGPCSGRCIL